MTKKTTVTRVNVREGKRSHGIKVETHDDAFVIPVIDVRDGENERATVNNISKNQRRYTGSKFMSRSYAVGGNSYQVSHKRNSNY
jgi:hypothetical protein